MSETPSRTAAPAGTLGDIGREWILFAIFASPILGITGTYGWEIIADFMIAWMLGIVFQYFVIVPMRDDVGKLAGVLLGLPIALAHSPPRSLNFARRFSSSLVFLLHLSEWEPEGETACATVTVVGQ
jgi:hypothetical protein